MAKLAGGVHRLDGQLMVVLEVDRVLELGCRTCWRHNDRQKAQRTLKQSPRG
jgi:hypothetical protein